MKWVTRLELLLPEMLRLLEQSVNMDSPSQRKDLTDRMIDWYEEICLSHLDARAIRVPNEEYADRLEIHIGSGQRTHTCSLDMRTRCGPQANARKGRFV
ncbi:hypothetical protein PVOR_11775 [Paenibacillus vortex V453]|uniref:Uncharacterized protein n=1 Tax=Paenibacillus vortex V453 TaxID=715225 RepID=A0A2R9SW52_9BACL|nr:hypothetical protein [Paenibacillus vortex]EFU41619.1 hypothetical protein PVOR_11775 [Paenibacillus vortex V453]